ncbi:MAG: biopolymer transporter ExbD [Planctomycetota bacterium]|nr:biopolymer transporter ExbD [Planctomycetota bacterium]
MARLKRRVKQDYETEENLTPLIDCIFLLLIFLMCVTEITKTENDQLLILPFAQSATKDEKPDERIVINVYPYDFPVGKIRKNAAMDAWVTINGEAMSWGDLQNYLEMIARTARKIRRRPGWTRSRRNARQDSWPQNNPLHERTVRHGVLH